MRRKAQIPFMLRYSMILAAALFILGPFPCGKVAAAAPANTLGPPQEIEQMEDSEPAPRMVGIARVQSMAQKTVQEEAIQSRASGLTPPPPTVSKSGGRIKKDKTLAASSSQDKNEMRQVRSSAIQDDDSLTSGSDAKGTPSKGKSAASKDDF